MLKFANVCVCVCVHTFVVVCIGLAHLCFMYVWIAFQVIKSSPHCAVASKTASKDTLRSDYVTSSMKSSDLIAVPHCCSGKSKKRKK